MVAREDPHDPFVLNTDERRQYKEKLMQRDFDAWKQLSLAVQDYARRIDRNHSYELTQEVLCSLFRGGVATYDPRRSLKTWMLTVIRNKNIDLLRRRNLRHMFSLDTFVGESDTSFKETVIDENTVTPLEAMCKDEELRSQESIYERLSSEQKEMLILQYGRGARIKDIAQALQIPVGTVKSAMHRIKYVLKEMVPLPSKALCH